MLKNEFSPPTANLPDRWTVGQHLNELRATFGAQDWLTVVGGATAHAYRLAGLTGVAFASLLRSQTEERGRLLIHLRRKPIMALRKGFDGSDGGIWDKDGLTELKLHFRGGSYLEEEGRVSVRGPLPTALMVTGPLNRPIGRLLPGAPRCVAGLRATALRAGAWGPEFVVEQSLETLATMPDAFADALGLERQRHLGHIPWLRYEGPAPVGAEPVGVASIAPRVRPTRTGAKPALRVVASN